MKKRLVSFNLLNCVYLQINLCLFNCYHGITIATEIAVNSDSFLYRNGCVKAKIINYINFTVCLRAYQIYFVLFLSESICGNQLFKICRLFCELNQC